MLLLGNIINWLLSTASSLSVGVLNSVKDVFTSSSTPITSLTKFITDYIVNINGLDLEKLMFVIAFGIITIQVGLAVLNSMTSELTGKRSENIVNIVANGIFAVFLIALFFGTSAVTNKTFYNGGLLNFIAEQFNKILSTIYKGVVYESVAQNPGIQMNLSPSVYVMLLILTGGILGSIISGAIGIVERVVQLAAFILMGPVALSLYTSAETRDCAKQWIRGIISQYVAIAMSLLFWCAAMNSLNVYYSKDSGISAGAYDDGIAAAVICVALFSLAGNAEELLNVLGLKTMSAMDAAKMVGGGFHEAMHISSLAGGAVKNGIDMLKNKGQIASELKATKNGLKNGLGAIGDTLTGNGDKGALTPSVASSIDKAGKELGKLDGDSVLGNTTAKAASDVAKDLKGLTSSDATSAFNPSKDGKLMSAHEGMSALSAATGDNLRNIGTNGLVNGLSQNLSKQEGSFALSTGTFENAAGKKMSVPVGYARTSKPATESQIMQANDAFNAKCIENNGQWLSEGSNLPITELQKDDIKDAISAGTPLKNAAGQNITPEMYDNAINAQKDIFTKAGLISDADGKSIVKTAGESVLTNEEAFVISPASQQELQNAGFTINDLKRWNGTDVSGMVQNINIGGSGTDSNKYTAKIATGHPHSTGTRILLNEGAGFPTAHLKQKASK